MQAALRLRARRPAVHTRGSTRTPWPPSSRLYHRSAACLQHYDGSPVIGTASRWSTPATRLERPGPPLRDSVGGRPTTATLSGGCRSCAHSDPALRTSTGGRPTSGARSSAPARRRPQKSVWHTMNPRHESAWCYTPSMSVCGYPRHESAWCYTPSMSVCGSCSLSSSPPSLSAPLSPSFSAPFSLPRRRPSPWISQRPLRAVRLPGVCSVTPPSPRSTRALR